MAPTTAAAMGSVPVDKAGVGSAVLNSMRQVGGSLGIAMMGAIVAASCTSRRPTPRRRTQFVDGLPARAARRRGDRVRRRRSSPSRPSASSEHAEASRAASKALRRERAPPGGRSAARRWSRPPAASSPGSYRGSTTAQIAREAGVTEPILYRHFASKRDLYLACLDAAWDVVRILWDKALEGEPDPDLAAARWAGLPRGAGRRTDRAGRPLGPGADRGERRRRDPPLLRAQMREVHDFVADVIRRAQAGRRHRARPRRRRGGLDLHLARPARRRSTAASATWSATSSIGSSTAAGLDDRQSAVPGIAARRRTHPTEPRCRDQKRSPRLRLRGLLVFALL